MRLAIMGLGNMGRALAERLLGQGHELLVWNRTRSRTAELAERGAVVLDSPDGLGAGVEAVLVCLADDASVADVVLPDGNGRTAWTDAVVVNTATVSAETTARLAASYGDRFVAAPIVGAPQAVRTGAARFITGGPASACQALAPVWTCLTERIEAGADPVRAVVMKLLNNQMLLAGLAVVAETVRIGRAAGIDDTVLSSMLRDSAQMPPGLQNRRDGLFDPEHSGWFTSPLAAKDLSLALELATGTGTMPLTEAARAAYQRVAEDGWGEVDVTALTEYGRQPPGPSTRR